MQKTIKQKIYCRNTQNKKYISTFKTIHFSLYNWRLQNIQQNAHNIIIIQQNKLFKILPNSFSFDVHHLFLSESSLVHTTHCQKYHSKTVHHRPHH